VPEEVVDTDEEEEMDGDDYYQVSPRKAKLYMLIPVEGNRCLAARMCVSS
jgi:hypothetical protein